MRLSLSTLKAGILWWQENWGRDYPDILNSEYYDIYNARKNGLSVDWWNLTVLRLSRWRAIRSRRPPNTIIEIRQRGLHVLPNLQKMYNNIFNKAKEELSLVNFKWDQLNNSYNDLAWIKNSNSPVFPSKLGHFIFPKIFMPVDNMATGIPPSGYDSFWTSKQRAWIDFNEKEEAKGLLYEEITRNSDKTIHDLYPFETKIIELCVIGNKHS